MNIDDINFSDDFLKELEKLEGAMQESTRKEEIRKKRAEGGKLGGRPVLSKKREFQKNVRLNENEKNEIEALAKAYGITESELFRRSALNISLPNPERNKILSDYKTHFSRIANFFRNDVWNENEKNDFKQELKEIISLIKSNLIR